MAEARWWFAQQVRAREVLDHDDCVRRAGREVNAPAGAAAPADLSVCSPQAARSLVAARGPLQRAGSLAAGA